MNGERIRGKKKFLHVALSAIEKGNWHF